MTAQPAGASAPASVEGLNRLAALGAHLTTRDLRVELTHDGLRVTAPDAAGCCAEVPARGDTVRTRTRPEDESTLWFVTSWNEPIAPADAIVDAAVRIVGYLTPHTRHP